MSLHRFFLAGPLTPGEVGPLPLSSADLHHAAEALRIRVGEELAVVAPAGDGWVVRVTDVSASEVLAAKVRPLAPESLPWVTLVQAMPKRRKMDEIVTGSIEVGVSEIWPVETDRSVVRLDPDRAHERAERWSRVAEAAAKQAGRSFRPMVRAPVALDSAGAELASFDAAIVFWEEATTASVRQVIASAGLGSAARVAVIVGPEGGLAASEVDTLVQAGAVVCSLGPTVLRTETAAVVGTALVIYELGGLGNEMASAKS